MATCILNQTEQVKMAAILLDGHGYVGPAGTPVTMTCVMAEAAKQQIDPAVLLAVLRTENGRTGKVTKNRNGSYDVGPFQINNSRSSPIWKLAGQMGMSVEQFGTKLAYDGCFSAGIGAWMLRHKINLAGNNVWKGVQWYNSANAVGKRYVVKVANKYRPLRHEYGMQ